MGRSWKNRLGSFVVANLELNDKMLISRFGIRLSSSARIVLKIFCALVILLPDTANAGRFVPGANCSDGPRTCVDSGEKVIDGFKVTKDCWQWVYTKTCNYPSKNDCSQYSNCYLVALGQCLLKDSVGNCVNQVKEYSCKKWMPEYINKEKVRQKSENKEAVEKLVCRGAPCIDGNCVDKSYDSNNEMLDSISKLYAISQMKGTDNMNMDTQLFNGYHAHCMKKPLEYTNCCRVDGASGWGRHLGAGCSKDEITLMEQRKKNLCVYVGKSSSSTLGLKFTKLHWCCFGNMLNKVLQVEGRKQLGIDFGSGSSPDCRGLTFTEIVKLDFDNMDFSEFEADIVKKMKMPVVNDVQTRIQGSIHSVQEPKDERTLTGNGMDGVNSKISTDK